MKVLSVSTCLGFRELDESNMIMSGEIGLKLCESSFVLMTRHENRGHLISKYFCFSEQNRIFTDEKFILYQNCKIRDLCYFFLAIFF